jgi:hypothetical protein
MQRLRVYWGLPRPSRALRRSSRSRFRLKSISGCDPARTRRATNLRSLGSRHSNFSSAVRCSLKRACAGLLADRGDLGDSLRVLFVLGQACVPPGRSCWCCIGRVDKVANELEKHLRLHHLEFVADRVLDFSLLHHARRAARLDKRVDLELCLGQRCGMILFPLLGVVAVGNQIADQIQAQLHTGVTVLVGIIPEGEQALAFAKSWISCVRVRDLLDHAEKGGWRGGCARHIEEA